MRACLLFLASAVATPTFATTLTVLPFSVDYAGSTNYEINPTSANAKVSGTVDVSTTVALAPWNNRVGLLQAVDLSVSSNPQISGGVNTIRTNPGGCLFFGVCETRDISISATAPVSINLSGNFGGATSPSSASLSTSVTVPALPPSVFRTFSTQPSIFSQAAAGLSIGNASNVINGFSNIDATISSRFDLGVDASIGTGSPTLVQKVSGQANISGKLSGDYTIDTLQYSASKQSLQEASDVLGVLSKSIAYAGVAASAGDIINNVGKGATLNSVSLPLLELSRNVANLAADEAQFPISKPSANVTAVLDSVAILRDSIKGAEGDPAAIASAVLNSAAATTKALSIYLDYLANDPPSNDFHQLDDFTSQAQTARGIINQLLSDPNLSKFTGELSLIDKTIQLAAGAATANTAYERYQGALLVFDLVSAEAQAVEVQKSLNAAATDGASYANAVLAIANRSSPTGAALSSSDISSLRQAMELARSLAKSDPLFAQQFFAGLLFQVPSNIDQFFDQILSSLDKVFGTTLNISPGNISSLISIGSNELMNPDGSVFLIDAGTSGNPSGGTGSGSNSGGSTSGNEPQSVPEPASVILVGLFLMLLSAMRVGALRNPNF